MDRRSGGGGISRGTMVWRTCREELPLAVVCGWAFRAEARVGIVAADEDDFELGDAERRGDVRLDSRNDGRSSGSGCTGVGRVVLALAREGSGRCLGVSGTCKRARWERLSE